MANWLSDYALAAEELGLTQNGNALAYDSSLTLAETATFAARVHSLFAMGGVEFLTGDSENWYDPYVDYLKENEILNSDLDYHSATTREQFVGLMSAALPEDVELELINSSADFVDADDISESFAADLFCRARYFDRNQRE